MTFGSGVGDHGEHRAPATMAGVVALAAMMAAVAANAVTAEAAPGATPVHGLALSAATAAPETDVRAPAASAPPLQSGLDRLIGSRLEQPELDGTVVSALFRTVEGDVLYERSPDRPLVPASNMKIVTAACALSTLGQDYEFVTLIGTDGAIEDEVLNGDLYVLGSGDPSLVSEEMWKICESLAARGIRRVEGDLVLDASRFDAEQLPIPDGDDGDRAYNARTSALSLNFNTIAVHVYPGVRRGDDAIVSVTPDVGVVDLKSSASTGSSRRGSSIEVRRGFDGDRNTVRVTGRIPEGSVGQTFYRNLDAPSGCFGAALVGFLKMAGIEVAGEFREGPYPENAVLLHRHESKALSLIVRDMGKYSNNFVAEQLLKELAAEIGGQPGTTEGGAGVLSDYLASLGAEDGTYVVVDGSGFSRDNRLTTRNITRVMIDMMSDFEYGYEFIASLSVGGVDGTLSDRMGFPGLRGSVRAKTGLLNGVTAISGLLRTVYGGDVVFSIITNGSACEAWRLHDLEHEILAYVAREAG